MKSRSPYPAINYGRSLRENDEIVNIADLLSAEINPTPINSEQLTIDDTPNGKGLTAAKYAGATKAVIQVETAPIRVTIDGTNHPTSTYGLLYNPGDEICLESAKEIVQFKAIRTTPVSGIINVAYSS